MGRDVISLCTFYLCVFGLGRDVIFVYVRDSVTGKIVVFFAVRSVYDKFLWVNFHPKGCNLNIESHLVSIFHAIIRIATFWLLIVF